MSDPIEAHELRKSFRARGKVVEAVRGVSFAVPAGQIFGFLGPNGAGKTTTLRMLTTLLPIDSGTATVAGFDVGREPKRGARRGSATSASSAAPTTSRPGARTSCCRAASTAASRARGRARASSELLELLDLASFADRRAKTYSGGQRRRLDVALGIVHEPEVLFLDEPTTGLDPQNRANLWEHVRRPARARHDRLPHDALPRGGRQPLRPRDDHRPRRDRRRGQPARAQARRDRRLGRAARRRRRPRSERARELLAAAPFVSEVSPGRATASCAATSTTAPPRCPRSCGCSTARTSRCARSASPSRRSTTCSLPRPAARCATPAPRPRRSQQ